ncbi:MAG: chorismate synthase [Candidatus Omnitrophica bacterium]|nr:chorismate synthase [Candidatus Omnitrophota bacterium]MDD5436077.1 chorismate synthase [Candidatus Omnitrophota bacterium]
MLRYLTSGESHGKCMLAILDGIPAGLKIEESFIDEELCRRMFGYGRGSRMKIERDSVEILSGLRRSQTIGSPIAIMINNADQSIDRLPVVLEPRPGHADLAGAMKYDRADIRDVLERASARETAVRVGVGAVCKILLSEFGIRITSHVTAIGKVESRKNNLGYKQIITLAERSAVRCADSSASVLMCKEITRAMADGDTLGGVFEVIASGVPAGLGSYAQWDRRLDGILAQAVMSIQAVKAVGFGLGSDLAGMRGSSAHDEIFYSKARGFYRKTNNAGGIEGGMTNGEDIRIRACMKPIATLRKPLASVNIKTKKAFKATVERSDTCAVPAAGVIGEAVVAVEIANAMIGKFGGDSIGEMRRNFDGYLKQIKKF